MEVELRVEHVREASAEAVRAQFAAHGWVTACELTTEDVGGVAARCARVRFRTRTADDAAREAMLALGSGAAGGAVAYAPGPPLAFVAPPLAAAPALFVVPAVAGAPAPTAGADSLSPVGAGPLGPSPLRRGGGAALPPPPMTAAVPATATAGVAASAASAAGAPGAPQGHDWGGCGSRACAQPPPPPPVEAAAYAAGLPAAAHGYGGYAQPPLAYAAPPQPVAASFGAGGAAAVAFVPGTSRLAFGTDQGRFLQEDLNQRARAGAPPNPFRAYGKR
jgi:hypothetical protein